MIYSVGIVFLFLTCANIRDIYTKPIDEHSKGLDGVNINLRRPDGYIHNHKREALIQNDNSTDVKTALTKDTNIPQKLSNETNSIQSDSPKNIPVTKNEPQHDGLTEGGIGNIHINLVPNVDTSKNDTKVQSNFTVADPSKGNNTKANETVTAQKISSPTNATITPKSEAEAPDSGVVKRGLIVFGGFSLLAVAYFIFYRKKNKKYDGGNTHNSNDTNQFRYGVLQSDDRRDNLELSRIPLTMESDEDEDDLEIFDLEQKKKSLSYVNLQANDEDIVLNGSKDESKNNLLLDIEDGPSDTLINWSSNGNKSIL